MTTFWQQARQVGAKDLRSEIRSGEVLFVTAPFGAVALLLIPLAVGTDVPLLRGIGSGMYWVVVLLFGVMVALRQSSVDSQPQRDMLSLLGIDPAARFTGQAGATFVLLLAFASLLAPVAGALYNPDISSPAWLLLIIPLVTAGLALLGTLAGSLTARLTSGTALVPLLVTPLAVPLLLAATQSLDVLLSRESILGWLLLLVALDLVLAIAGVLSARTLQEPAR